jgi:lysophospholipid acyltransferase (LPLAT)-like uncharacterized protein
MATSPLLKRILSHPRVQWAVSAAIVACGVTGARFTRIELPPPPSGGPFVLAMWHGRLITAYYLLHKDRPVVALVSGNRDGQVLANICHLVGIRTVSGSSSRGGARAVRELVRLTRDGWNLLITPDGPRGPRMRAQRGILDIARLSGLPILPVSVSSSRAVLMKSWDRFLIPLPFTRIVVRWGEPIAVGADADSDALLLQLEDKLTALQDAADAACGRSPIEPMPRRPADETAGVSPDQRPALASLRQTPESSSR